MELVFMKRVNSQVKIIHTKYGKIYFKDYE